MGSRLIAGSWFSASEALTGADTGPRSSEAWKGCRERNQQAQALYKEHPSEWSRNHRARAGSGWGQAMAVGGPGVRSDCPAIRISCERSQLPSLRGVRLHLLGGILKTLQSFSGAAVAGELPGTQREHRELEGGRGMMMGMF